MTWEQGAILAVLGGTLAVFVWDRWRYDVVAIASLMVAVLLGLVPPETALSGFSNPAVITVAAVLVISRALARSGAVDALAGRLIDAASSRFYQSLPSRSSRCASPASPRRRWRDELGAPGLSAQA